jgi:hypothetical protein
VCYLPTPTSTGFYLATQSQPAEEEYPPNDHNPSHQSPMESSCALRSNISVAANVELSPAVTLTQKRHRELETGGDEQEEAGGIISGSPEDGVIPGSPMVDAPSPNLELSRSPTPLEPLFQGSGSPEFSFGDIDEIDLLEPIPQNVPTNEAEATAELLHGIELSSWEPTPSIHGDSRRDRLPPTFDRQWGLWHNSNASVDRYHREDNVLYKEFGTVRASRIREEELQYGWKLVRSFVRTSVFSSPANIGGEVNRRVSGFFFFRPRSRTANQG